MEIFVSNGDVKATITTKSEKISLDNSELYKLIQNALGYSKTEKVEVGLHDDTYYYTYYTETYGDKADKELLRLIKIRLDKKPKQLKPVTYSWKE